MTEVAGSYLILLERYLLPAAAEGLKTLVVHLIEGPVVTISGVKNYVYEKEFDEYIARLKRTLSRVERLCRENKVALALENSKTVPYMERRMPLCNTRASLSLSISVTTKSAAICREKFFKKRTFAASRSSISTTSNRKRA